MRQSFTFTYINSSGKHFNWGYLKKEIELFFRRFMKRKPIREELKTQLVQHDYTVNVYKYKCQMKSPVHMLVWTLLLN